MAKPKSAFTEAAAELYSDLGNRYWADIIPSEAREYVTADVIVSWLASESQGREYETICADVMAQRLTSDQARTLLLAASIDYSAKVLELFKDAVVEQVARTRPRGLYFCQRMVLVLPRFDGFPVYPVQQVGKRTRGVQLDPDRDGVDEKAGELFDVRHPGRPSRGGHPENHVFAPVVLCQHDRPNPLCHRVQTHPRTGGHLFQPLGLFGGQFQRPFLVPSLGGAFF